MYHAGEVIYEKDDKVNSFFIILKGNVTVHTAKNASMKVSHMLLMKRWARKSAAKTGGDASSEQFRRARGARGRRGSMGVAMDEVHDGGTLADADALDGT